MRGKIMTGRGRAVRSVACLLAQNYPEHGVGGSAAALAYYLLFALFPVLIFISSLLGRLNLDAEQVARELVGVLPGAIVGLMTDYLRHVNRASGDGLLWFSLVFSVWFPMRAAGGLMDGVRRACGLGRPAHPLRYRVRQLLFTLALLAAIALTLGLFVLDRVLLPGILPALWKYLRFLPVGLALFLLLAALYELPQEEPRPFRALLPGVGAALGAWLAVSAGFSLYADRFADYSAVYGALGAVIALMVWLYLTALILIMGAELNAAIWLVRGSD